MIKTKHHTATHTDLLPNIRGLNSKWIARVRSDQYNYLRSKLNHGQPTLLLRMILASLITLIKDGKLTQILGYLTGETSLTLPAIANKGKKEC